MSGRSQRRWVLQVVCGVVFIVIGAMHLIMPEGPPEPLSWMYDLSDRLHLISGIAEILGGLGLILPGLTKIAPKLTVLAASGLVLVMVGAAIWHVDRGEIENVVENLLIAATMAFVAYGRWKLEPLPGRVAASPAGRTEPPDAVDVLVVPTGFEPVSPP